MEQMIEYAMFKMIEDPDYDAVYGMTQALYAAQKSDHTTQVGAYCEGLSGSNEYVHQGDYRPHAEVETLLYCARMGVATGGSTLYAPWACCPACAEAIISAGITRVVTSLPVMEATAPRWTAKVNNGLNMLVEAGVALEIIMKPVGQTIIMDGKVVNA